MASGWCPINETRDHDNEPGEKAAADLLATVRAADMLMQGAQRKIQEFAGVAKLIRKQIKAATTGVDAPLAHVVD